MRLMPPAPTSSALDPAAQWTGARSGHAFLAYIDNYLIDVTAAIIIDAEAMRAVRQVERIQRLDLLRLIGPWALAATAQNLRKADPATHAPARLATVKHTRPRQVILLDRYLADFFNTIGAVPPSSISDSTLPRFLDRRPGVALRSCGRCDRA